MGRIPLEQLRRSRKKVAWAAVILLIVGMPLVLFALVGLPHLFRGSLVRNVIAREPGGEPPESLRRISRSRPSVRRWRCK